MTGKSFWKSKILWANVVALVAFIVQSQTGFVVPPELQGVALGAINMALRLITGQPLQLKERK